MQDLRAVAVGPVAVGPVAVGPVAGTGKEQEYPIYFHIFRFNSNF